MRDEEASSDVKLKSTRNSINHTGNSVNLRLVHLKGCQVISHVLTKGVIQMANKHGKGVQGHLASQKYKWKAQWDNIPYPQKWL